MTGATMRATSGPSEVVPALSAALAGGPPVAPLPSDDPERGAALAMLAPERPVTEPDSAAIVATSGSTGHPKGVVLSRRAIVASVAATHARLGGPGTWVLALPVHYVAGLMVVARSLLAGTAPVIGATDLSDLAAATARLTGRRYLAVVPTQLARALDNPPVVTALASLDAVLVGGGPLPPALRERAESCGIPVVSTYGLSETCGGCVYDGRPLESVEVTCPGPEGRIQVRGPVLFAGYRLRPDLTDVTLTDGTLRTEDRGRWSGGRLEVLGRVDDVVVSAGHNVDLAALEHLARTWPGLGGGEVAVVGLPDPDRGIRVVAATAAVDDPAALRDYLARRVPVYATPREWRQLDRLPRNDRGKLDRVRLRTELTEPG